ncbi:hypothetical protein [Actinosynnema sp.]|uniref:hypothetical protein n=1 Tax=Actinosynnema sp. TaxID=1872144 RepID=UPI003F872394
MLADPQPAGGTAALWSSSDLPGLGDQLLVRVIERELRARLGDWCVRPFAPHGWTRPQRADAGFIAEPLGERTPRRVRELAENHHLHLVAPSFPLGDDLAARYGADVPGAAFFTAGLGLRPDAACVAVRVAESVPAELVAWAGRQPLLSVRDEESARRLREAGAKAEVAVVGHPGLLLERLLPADSLKARANQLRQLGQLPAGGRSYLVVQVPAEGFEKLRPTIAKIVELLAVQDVVLLPIGVPVPEGDWVALPPDTVLEDRAAVLADSAAVIAVDEHVAAAAQAYGRNWVLLDPTGREGAAAELFGAVERVAQRPSQLAAAFRRALKAGPGGHEEAVRALDEHLDAVAETAEAAFAASGQGLPDRVAALVAENRALRVAHHRLRERVTADRHAMVELTLGGGPVEGGPELEEERRLHGELAERHRELVERLGASERELDAMRRTKLFRYTRALRFVYGKLRSR